MFVPKPHLATPYEKKGVKTIMVALGVDRLAVNFHDLDTKPPD